MKTMHKIFYISMLFMGTTTSIYLEGALKKNKTHSSRLASKGKLSSSSNTQSSPSVPQEIVLDTVQEVPTTVEPVVSATNNTDASIQQLVKTQEEPSILQAPIHPEEPEEADVIFNFENADLQNLISYMEKLFKVTFIPDDVINPILQTGKAIGGNKISFKTHRPLTKSQAWSLFLTFLDMAGLSLYQEGVPHVYRVTTINNVKKSPIPAFIGVDSELLPDNDTKIRYIYFIENTTLDTLKGIIDSLRSSSSSITFLQELKAFMLTDSAYNIKVLMRVVRELDKVTLPQAMSVLKLKKVDALRVKSLYDSLTQQPEQAGAAPGRIIAPRRPGGQYFPEDARIIAEPRTNSLILLGSNDAISKIEEFIIKYIDIDLEAPYSPLHIFPLKYAEAETVAAIMNNVTKFGSATPAAQSGGVRGQDKYLKPMTFTAEPVSNRVIVRGDYEDFLKAREVMQQLDEPQPQVAIEVLILSVTINEQKQLGAQIRSTATGGPNGLLGDNVKFQTSGLAAGGLPQGVVTNPNPATGNQRLLGDLINLVVGKGVGNTIISLGTDQFGIWGIFNILESVVNTQVISNPFLIATNKSAAEISLGETRRVVTGTVLTQGNTTNTLSDNSANLTLKITPQINSDGMIVLNLVISIDTFISPLSSLTPAKTTRKIDTATVVADKEVLALGGLIRNNISDNVTQVPVLGNIPILGWLFKNKQKSETKECLLILLSTRILEPTAHKTLDTLTKNHLEDYHADIRAMANVINERDVIDRSFFKPKQGSTETVADAFIFKNNPELKNEFDADYNKIVITNPPAFNVPKPITQQHGVPATSINTLPAKPIISIENPIEGGTREGVPPTPEAPVIPVPNVEVVATPTKKRERMSLTSFAQSNAEGTLT